MKAAAIVAVLIALILGAHGLTDYIDRTQEDRLSYQRWVTGACIPTAAGHSAIIISDGKKLTCTLYSRNARGLAPIVVSAAVMEAPE